MTPNTEWKKVAASLIAAVIFVLIFFLSYLFIDGMDGGYAIAFVSLFLAISSIAVALLFVHRARVMDTILADPSLLAHWTYPEDVARVSVEREYGEFQERNRAVFFIVGGMLVIVALFFLIFVEDGGLETGIFLLALMVFLYIVSRIMPWIERQRAMKASHDAFLSHFGIIYEGVVYPFRSFLVWKTGIQLRKAAKKKPMAIIFSFSQLVDRFIIQPFDVVIPIPTGEEERAVWIVREMGGEVPDDYP
ncbi:MAG: hypothetical protein CVV30_08245 [Methanomicrobiales archaeon HGW-Methanomicrobiales-1]|nr:MAG: hypothetical protein CVV30_08245 [Methanomicrobiales archaeon HGW-Methanomicrobiales-1]